MNPKEIEQKTDFVVSWYAKKYNKVIFRVGNLSKDGCRTWEQDGKNICVFGTRCWRDIQRALTQ